MSIVRSMRSVKKEITNLFSMFFDKCSDNVGLVANIYSPVMSKKERERKK